METESGEPAGFKIPILNTSGVTKNLLNNQLESQAKNRLDVIKNIDGTVKVNGTATADTFLKLCTIFLNKEEYWLSGCPSGGNISNGYMLNLTSAEPIRNYYDIGNDVALHPNPAGNYTVYIIVRKGCVCDNLLFKPMLSETRPDHYIPHRYESNYDLFIGGSKLGEEEYVDFESQKVYKYVDGVLTPQDPPLPFPAISTYKGKNTLSSTDTLGDIELTGDWLAIMGSTEDESIDIGFTVDAEEYTAFVTVDDGPSIQVSDTITMPSSAGSFTLQVVSWGRERYTDTVYNALS